MSKRFQSTSWILWIILPTIIIYWFLMVHWPYAIPFRYLGPLGRLTYYLISNYRFLLFIAFWSMILAHLYEAFVARRICQQLNIDSQSTKLWIIQTFVIGIINLLK